VAVTTRSPEKIIERMESSNLKKRFIRWMEENRGLILTVIGLPASFIFDTILRVKKIDTYLFKKIYFLTFILPKCSH
jgi:uncharacterized protein YceK